MVRRDSGVDVSGYRGRPSRSQQALQLATYAGRYAWQNRASLAREASRAYNYLTEPSRRRVPQTNTMAPIPRSYRNSRRTPYPKLKKCRPKVKNSKKFVAKVQAVESSGTAKGTSTLRIMGCVRINNVSNYQRPTQDLYYGANTLLQSSAPGNPNIPNVFAWFTAGGLLHHASVLFNGKPNDVDESLTTLNLNEENLVLEIPYCSVTMKLTNHSMQVQELDFYQCVPKISSNITALDDWTNKVASAAENINGQNQFWYGAEPGQVESFTQKWSYKKKTFVLAPGASASHFVKQGPLCYTYSKFLNNTTNWNFPKGIGMSCFFVARQPHVHPTNTKFVGHCTIADASSDYNAITCELVSKYVIEAPELCTDTQKFDKYATNSYINSGTSIYTQLQLPVTGDPFKTVYQKEPAQGHVAYV